MATEKLLQCLLCQHATPETNLSTHIKYNHMVYQETILKVLYKLHFPPVTKTILCQLLKLKPKKHGGGMPDFPPNILYGKPKKAREKQLKRLHEINTKYEQEDEDDFVPQKSTKRHRYSQDYATMADSLHQDAANDVKVSTEFSAADAVSDVIDPTMITVKTPHKAQPSVPPRKRKLYSEKSTLLEDDISTVEDNRQQSVGASETPFNSTEPEPSVNDKNAPKTRSRNNSHESIARSVSAVSTGNSARGAASPPPQEVNYDDVYGRRGDESAKNKAISRLRQLQENDLAQSLDQGTYVQCCECGKWRQIMEVDDPSQVPDYWVCNMNSDTHNNSCAKGQGVDILSDDEDLVTLQFALGSVVWAKVPRYPWWPAMVDYCPVAEEIVRINQDGDKREVTAYHVVFFDQATRISRSWVNTEHIVKMTDPASPPANCDLKSDSVRRRLTEAREMASTALGLSRFERVQRFSFAYLYKGKWGQAHINQDGNHPLSNELEIDVRLVGLAGFKPKPAQVQPPDSGNGQPTPHVDRNKVQNRKRSDQGRRHRKSGKEDDISWQEDFHCLRCGEAVMCHQERVNIHLRKHRLSFSDYLEKYETSAENTSKVPGTSKSDNDIFSDSSTPGSRGLERVRQWLASKQYLDNLPRLATSSRRSSKEIAEKLRAVIAQSKEASCSTNRANESFPNPSKASCLQGDSSLPSHEQQSELSTGQNENFNDPVEGLHAKDTGCALNAGLDSHEDANIVSVDIRGDKATIDSTRGREISDLANTGKNIDEMGDRVC